MRRADHGGDRPCPAPFGLADHHLLEVGANRLAPKVVALSRLSIVEEYRFPELAKLVP
jgi:hypothetical protein